VLLSLVAVLLVSVLTFNWQVRRWTTNRAWRALLDWARERGWKLSNQDVEPPEPFDRLPAARATTLLTGKSTRAFQLETQGGSAVQTPRWHVLVRDLQTAWPPTGLRPSQAPASLLDLFSLSSFPRMGEVERFVVFGTESKAARILSKSPARALLPPDIGLLLSGGKLVLDFSTRPFDPIELGRMTALAEQLVTHLPPPVE
jgi:hypothetical protein